MFSGSLIYLFVAYTIVWIALFGYMFFLSQQVSDLRSQLDAVRRLRQAPKPTTQPKKPHRR